MGCRKTGSFLDLPLMAVVINSAKSLPLQLDNCRVENLIRFRKFVIIYFVKFSFQEKMSLKTKSYSHQSWPLVAVSVLFLCIWPEICQKFIQFLLRIISSDSVFLTHSFSGLTSFQYAWNVTTAFFVAFLVFSESLPSIKFCISSSDKLEKRFLLAWLGSIIDHRWYRLQLKTGNRSASLSIKLTWALAEDHAILLSGHLLSGHPPLSGHFPKSQLFVSKLLYLTPLFNGHLY